MATSALTLAVATATALLLSPSVRRRASAALAVSSRGASTATASALTGILYRYKAPQWPAPLQAFESPINHRHERYCIYVGGLTDGLLACKYVDQLAGALDLCGWALVQPVLTSSYTGYGCSSLSRDAEELSRLISHIDERDGAAGRPAKAFAIVGHSTGCQDAVTLLRSAPLAVRIKLRAAVLQAPVSDREAASLDPDPEGRASTLARAEALVAAGRGASLLPDDLHNGMPAARSPLSRGDALRGPAFDVRASSGFVPISAARYASLAGALGPDDMFSSDLSDEELRTRLGHMGTTGQREGIRGTDADQWLVEPLPEHPGLRTCFAHAGADEYVPRAVDVDTLSRRFIAAAGGRPNGAEAVIIRDGNHNLATPPAADGEFVEVVCRVLKDAVP